MMLPNFPYFDLQKHQSDLPPTGKILVAPLHWGLGHATRCIPIIHQLLEQGYDPILASDGAALLLLQKIFPQLKTYELPSYNITYSIKPRFFGLKMVSQLPHILSNLKREKQLTHKIVKNENIQAIISDNRFGVFQKDIPSIFITHQLRIKSGMGSWIATLWYQNIIQKFDFCWVPDVAETPNLSGNLSHDIALKIPIRYIGMLSQHQPEKLPIQFDLLLLLSGPEPQRSIWEATLIAKYKKSPLRIVLVRGIVSDEKTEILAVSNWKVYPYLYGKELQDLLNASETVIARTGYSTLMDLMVLQKKAILTPTPFQPEQEYLARHIGNWDDWSMER